MPSKKSGGRKNIFEELELPTPEEIISLVKKKKK